MKTLIKAKQILSGRLFIGEALEKNGPFKRWGGLVPDTFIASDAEKITGDEFSSRLVAFESELVSVAQNDLLLHKRKQNPNPHPTVSKSR